MCIKINSMKKFTEELNQYTERLPVIYIYLKLPWNFFLVV